MNTPIGEMCRQYQVEVQQLRSKLKLEQKWSAFLMCCALSGEIPMSRENFDIREEFDVKEDITENNNSEKMEN